MTYGDHRLYLYEDNLELVVDAYGIYVDNRPMNNRKLQNVFSDTLSATLINPTTKRRIFTKILEQTSDVGCVKLILDEGDLQNVDEGLYTIYITRVKTDGNEYPVFADQNNGLKFQIQIDAQAKSEPVETQLANSFTQVADTGTGDPANIFTTSAIF